MVAKTRAATAKPVHRVAADAGLGLVLFVAFAIGLLGAPSFSDMLTGGQARAADLARVAAFTGPTLPSAIEPAAVRPAILISTRGGLQAQSSSTSAIALLAGVFAVLFAFNLAFFRHLRRVYVTPRRAGRRSRNAL
ncbi:MAG: hypothetical protein ACT4N2_03445 [Hyphomicrobium sp.]